MSVTVVEGTTPACESEHFDANALKNITDIVQRLRRCENGGCLGGQDDWFKLLQLEAPPPTPLPIISSPQVNSIQVVESARLAKRFADVMVTLKIAFDGFQKVQECISRQLKFCETHNRVLRWRAGLSSLPDEVLATILEYASITKDWVHGQLREERSAILTTRAAIILSHVCQRFRHVGHVVMQVSRLWNRICIGMDSGLISALCERLASPTAEIMLEERNSNTNAALFIRTVVPRAAYWRRFVLGRTMYDEGATDKELVEMVNAALDLHVPFLTELAIHYTSKSLLESQSPDAEGGNFHFYATWTAPRLRSLTMTNMVPVKFTSTSTLVCFNVALNCVSQGRGFMKAGVIGRMQSALIQFLQSCPVLKTISIALRSLYSSDGVSIRSPVEFTSVETLEFEFTSCMASQAQTFSNAIRFPNASAVKMKFSSYKIGLQPQDLLHAIIPDSDLFPRLERLELEFFVGVTWFGDEEHRTVCIPNFGSSKIQHLTLTTRNCYLGAIPDGPCLPALRSITFNDCDHLKKNWVAKLLERLKDQGNVPEVKMVGCTPKGLDEDIGSEVSSNAAPDPDEVHVLLPLA